MNLPQQPGLNRRLAYSNYIRQTHRRYRNNNFNLNSNLNSNLNLNFSDNFNGLSILNIYQPYKRGIYLNDLFRNSNVSIRYLFDCSICQEENNFDVNIVRKLNCNHEFHIYCIDKWLSKETTCPICRKNLSN